MNQQESLYEPSLESGWKETKSYDINRLFLVAFFGGVIPMIALGTQNAKWLNIPKKMIYSLIGLGAAILIAKIVFISLAFGGGVAGLDNNAIKIGYRVASIVLFLAYRYVLNKPFHQHLMTKGEVEPVLAPALIWIVIGAVVEGILVFNIS